MKSVDSFRVDLLDKLKYSNMVCKSVDGDGFSVVDMALADDDGDIEVFRLVITKLPDIFEKDEKVVEKVSKWL